MSTKQLRGTASVTELFQRLTAPTPYTRQAEPVAPPPLTASVARSAPSQRLPEPAAPPTPAASAGRTASVAMPAPASGTVSADNAGPTTATDIAGRTLSTDNTVRAPLPASTGRGNPTANASRATSQASAPNPPAAVTPAATAPRTRGNDPALNGSFSNSDDPENKLVYTFAGSELTITRNTCAVRYRYTTMVIAGTNYLTYTSLSDNPAGCGGPMGTEFSRTYKVNGSSILIESSRERPISLARGG